MSTIAIMIKAAFVTIINKLMGPYKEDIFYILIIIGAICLVYYIYKHNKKKDINSIEIKLSTNNMTCPSCGKPLLTNDKFCSNCGADVSTKTQK